ncbi:hypothetical protein EDB83DRAFT_2424676, partial [Lactarius deliciosus]
TAVGTCIVTYLARQDGLEGKRLHAADHATLLDVLAGLARMGVTVHVVDEKVSWTERMRAVAQSSIVLSVFRDHVANESTLMVFFLVTCAQECSLTSPERPPIQFLYSEHNFELDQSAIIVWKGSRGAFSIVD